MSPPDLELPGNPDAPASIHALRHQVDDLRERLAAEMRREADHARDREALHDAEERHRVLIDATLEGLMIHDAGVVIELNEAMARILGRPREELVGRPLSEFVPADILPLVESYENDTGDGRYDLRTTRRDGAPLMLEIASRPLTFRGRPVRLAVALDVTDARLAQEEANRTQKFDSLAAMAGGIAHDFNNILTAAIGNLSLARTMVREDSPLGQRVLEAEKALKRATELTGELLTFARGGSGTRSVASVPQVAQGSIPYALRGTPTRLELAAPPDLWPVRIDPVRLGRVLHNLAVHANLAMAHGGRVHVECANAPVVEATPTLEPGDYVAIRVKDDGAGIPPEHLAKVFEPYFANGSAGQGLGLASSYSIVHAHHGSISVTSEPGKGTTFEILLPAATEGEGCGEGPPPVRIACSTGRILLMDDEPTNRDVAARLLTPLGYDVVAVGEGDAALQAHADAIYRGRPFDVLILDLGVPGGLGGSDIIGTLLEREPSARVIASCSTLDRGALEECRHAGFRDVLPKPFRVESLSNVLQRALGDVRGGAA